MMRRHLRALTALLAAALLLTACGKTTEQTSESTTTATTAATTSVTTETQAGTAQSTSAATTAPVEPVIAEKLLPKPYINIDFYEDGTMQDTQGNVTVQAPDGVRGRVESSSMLFEGMRYTVPHLHIEKSGGLATLTHKTAKSEEELQTLLEDGFAIEALLVNGNKLSAGDTEQCMTTSGQAGGFGFSVNNGLYTFGVYTGNGWKRTTLPGTYDTGTLTHLLGVYDADTMSLTLYVNGKAVSTASAIGAFRPAQEGCWRRIILGGDTASSGTELHATKTRIADYKLYTTAMTAEQAALAYDVASAAITGQERDYKLVYVDPDKRPGANQDAIFKNLIASYADVYEPKTSLVCAPTVWQHADARSSTLADAEARPATVLYHLTTKDGLLHATDDAGNDLGTLYDCVKSLNTRIIPAFVVNDRTLALSLSSFLNKNRLADCFVISTDPGILKEIVSARGARPVLDARGAAVDVSSLFLTASACGTKTVLLDAASLTQETVLALQARSLFVVSDTAGTDRAAIHSTVFSGANGILTSDSAAVLDYYKSFTDRTLSTPTLMVAHRGDYEHCPDNTLRSLIAAAKSGASSTEFDVWMTADGHLVLNHDAKTTYWSEQLECTRATRAQLKALTCIDKRGQEGDEMAFYDEVMAYFSKQDTHMVFTVEIKDQRHEVVDKVVEIARQYGMLDRIFVICMNEGIDRYAYETYGVAIQDNLGNVYPRTDLPRALAQTCLDLSALPTSYYSQWSDESIPLYRMLRHRGVKYSPWTTANAVDNDRHYALGYPEFTTNVPHHSDNYVRFLKVNEAADGRVSVQAVYYDGHTEDVTSRAEFVTLSGQVSYQNGKVSGQGAYAFRLSLTLPNLQSHRYAVCSQAVTRPNH